MTSDDLLREAVEELYWSDPGEFTQRRADLAAHARTGGQAAVARQIGSLRKPTRSAWVINRLIRSDPGVAARLAALGEQLRAADRSRDGARLRELSGQRRDLIAAVLRQAFMVSGQHAPPAALRDEVTATFGAALADPEVAEQLRQGTLLRAERRPGFGAAAGPALVVVPAVPVGQKRGRKRPPKPAGPAGRPAAVASDRPAAVTSAQAPSRRPQAAQASGIARSAEKSRATREARAAQAAQAARARAEAVRAKAELDRRRVLARAEQALADAHRAAAAAGLAEQELEDTVQRLEKQLTDARRGLREARGQVRRAEIAQRQARQALDRLRG